MKLLHLVLASQLSLVGSLLAGPTLPTGLPLESGLEHSVGSWATLAAKAGKLEAPLASGGSLKGKAAYTEEAIKKGKIRQKVSIEVQGAIPGVRLDVIAGGVKVGSVTADAFGRAKLELKAGGDDPGSVKSLPFLKAGDSASVGGATGKFAAK